MELHKFGIKFFAADAEAVDILKLIPVYHRWIQQKVLADLLVAESWESMAMRSVARAEPPERDLVPVPVAVRRRAA